MTPSPLPVLFAARLPGGAWLVDASEAFVAAQAAGAPVLRLDVGALVRVARAGAALKAAREDIHATERAQWGELFAALAALGDSALLGKGE